MLLDDRFNVEIVNGRMQSQLNSLATRVNLQLEVKDLKLDPVLVRLLVLVVAMFLPDQKTKDCYLERWVWQACGPIQILRRRQP